MESNALPIINQELILIQSCTSGIFRNRKEILLGVRVQRVCVKPTAKLLLTGKDICYVWEAKPHADISRCLRKQLTNLISPDSCVCGKAAAGGIRQPAGMQSESILQSGDGIAFPEDVNTGEAGLHKGIGFQP